MNARRTSGWTLWSGYLAGQEKRNSYCAKKMPGIRVTRRVEGADLNSTRRKKHDGTAPSIAVKAKKQL